MLWIKRKKKTEPTNEKIDNNQKQYYAVWYTEGKVPLFDVKKRLRLYTKKNLLSAVPLAEFWDLPKNVFGWKEVKAKELDLFYKTMYIHYGCKSVVIDNGSPELLTDKTEIDFDHYNKSTPHHEVSNPDLRMSIILYNMLLKYSDERQKKELFHECLKNLNHAELLLPCSGINKGDILTAEITYKNGKQFVCVFTSFEAYSEMLKKGQQNSGIVQTIDQIFEYAKNRGLNIAVNFGSCGGGIVLEKNDWYQINGAEQLFQEAESYREGDSYPKGSKKAYELYKKAAELGHPIAQNNLAVMLETGTDEIPADITQAIFWYDAASDDFEGAAFVLGRKYDVGKDVERDLTKAARYYAKAARLGNPMAMYNLATMYLTGEGVEKNPQKATTYMIQSARGGFQPAIEMLKKNGISS